ncbi:MAG: cell envelope integrity protein TolA [Pseudomonadota bacterium]|jgi:colicin import membrane protein
MRWWRVNGWPMVLTVAIHIAVVWMVTVGWSSETAFSQPVSKPSLIKATVVDLAKPPKTADKKKTSTKTTAKKTSPKPKPVPKKTPLTQPAVKSATKPTQKPVEKPPEPKPSKPEPRPAVTPSPMDIDLSAALAEEDAAREAESEQDLVNSYIAKIMAMVESVWSRPPSARNGMQAILVVNLIPTGEVVNVSVAESSGNAAFDTSAVNAVYKVARFDDLQGMKGAMFEANFRRFRLMFKPEDLRL